MDTVVDPQEEQKTEIASLSAIYQEDCHVLSDQRGLEIKVRPSTEEVFCQASVRIEYSPQYPHTPPRIDVVDSHGLTAIEADELQTTLRNEAHQHQDTPVVFDIVQTAVEYVMRHNTRPKSLHEQMQEGDQARRQEQLERLVSEGDDGDGEHDSEEHGPGRPITGKRMSSDASLERVEFDITGTSPTIDIKDIFATDNRAERLFGVSTSNEYDEWSDNNNNNNNNNNKYDNNNDTDSESTTSSEGSRTPIETPTSSIRSGTFFEAAYSSSDSESGDSDIDETSDDGRGIHGEGSRSTTAIGTHPDIAPFPTHPPSSSSSSVSSTDDPRETLLVHLLDLFCTAYVPSDSRAFPVLAQQLRHMGILAGDYTRGTRGSKAQFRRLFRKQIAAAVRDGSPFSRLWASAPEPAAPSPAPAPAPSSARSLPSSRYRSDFEELGQLGRGAYGSVFHVRNKVDGREYATKKIVVRSVGGMRRILREVSLLSSLHHTNIVRYYTAWIEGFDEEDGANDSDEEDHELMAFGYPGTIATDSESESDALMDKDSSGEMDRTWASSGSALHDQRDEGRDRDLPPAKILYIQMEFCPRKTLRSLIDEDLRQNQDPDKVVRILRQVVEALAYMHRNGVIHRDIKPPNIFIGKAEDIKIGDFGLSTLDPLLRPTASASQPASGAVTPMLNSHQDPDQDGRGSALYAHSSSSGGPDGGVGTPIYCSPELENGERYTHKVDIFSLGVVLFEMLYPFETGMERIMTLQELRKTGKVPASFAKDHPKLARLVEAMVHSDPTERPSADDILEKELPPKLEEEHVRDALRSMTDPDSPVFPRLVSKLFEPASYSHSNSSGSVASLSASQSSAASALIAASSPIISRDSDITSMDNAILHQVVADRLRHIFRSHGAVDMPTAPLVPLADVPRPDAAAVFLDPSGSLIALPQDFAHPFARHVVHHLDDTPFVKRYQFGHLFRSSQISVSSPAEDSRMQRSLRSVSACSFDIVGTGHGQASDAEVLEVCCAVCDAFPVNLSSPSSNNSNTSLSSSGGHWEIRINHGQLVQCILEVCHVPHRHREVVCDSLTKSARGHGWSVTRRTLRDVVGLPAEDAEFLRTLCREFHGELSAVYQRVNQRLGKHRAARQALEELASITTHLERWNRFGRAVFNVADSRDFHIYGGVFFQIGIEGGDDSDRGSGVGGVGGGGRRFRSVMHGGRYDPLVQQRGREKNNPTTLLNDHSTSTTTNTTTTTHNININHNNDTSNGNVANSRGVVGVAISMDELCKRTFPTSQERRRARICATTEVMVYAYRKDVKEHMEIVKECWEAGIRADFVYDDRTPFGEVLEHCQATGIVFIVLVRGKDLALGRVKVKDVFQDPRKHKAETEIDRHQLIPFLRRYLSPSGGDSKSASSPKFHPSVVFLSQDKRKSAAAFATDMALKHFATVANAICSTDGTQLLVVDDVTPAAVRMVAQHYQLRETALQKMIREYVNDNDINTLTAIAHHLQQAQGTRIPAVFIYFRQQEELEVVLTM